MPAHLSTCIRCGEVSDEKEEQPKDHSHRYDLDMPLGDVYRDCQCGHPKEDHGQNYGCGIGMVNPNLKPRKSCTCMRYGWSPPADEGLTATA